MSSGQARRRVVRPRPIGPTAKSAAEYHRAVRDDLLAPMDEVLERIRNPDLSAADIRRELSGATTGASRAEAQRLRQAVARSARANDARLGSAFRKSMERVRVRRGGLGRGDRAAEAMLPDWERENRRLLRSVRGDQARRMRAIATDPRLRDDPVKMRRALRAQRGVVDRRVRTITRDQLETLSGEQVRVRQQAAGVSTYVWQSRDDDRVRPAHVALHGTIRRWTSSPRPGEPINCRCRAIANVDVNAPANRRRTAR